MDNKSLEKYLYQAAFFLTAFVFVIPLFFSNDLMFLNITTKAFIFRSVVEVLALIFILLAFINKKYLPKINIISGAVIIYSLYYIFSFLWSDNPSTSFWGNFERMEAGISQLHYLLFFIILISLFRQTKQWFLFFRTSLVVGFLAAFYALLQFFGVEIGNFVVYLYRDRVAGTLGNPIFYAAYILFQFFIIFWLLLKDNNRRWRYFYYFSLVFQFIIFVLTKTRGAMIGLMAAALLVFVLSFIFKQESKEKKAKKTALVFLIIFILGGLWFFRDTALIKSTPILSRYIDISLTTGTAKTRFWTWGSALKGWQEKPFFGWGVDNFSSAFNKHFNPRHFSGFGSEAWFDRSHNDPIDQLVMFGLVGLLLYLAVYFSLFFKIISKIIKNRGNYLEYALFLGVIAAYFIQNLFIFPTIVVLIMFYSVLAFIIFRLDNQEGFGEDKVNEKFLNSSKFILALLVLVFSAVYFVHKINYIPYKSNKDLVRGIRLIDIDPQESGQRFASALEGVEKTPIGFFEVNIRIASLIIDKINYGEIDKKIFFSNYELIEPGMSAYADKMVGDSRFVWILGKLYNTAYENSDQDRLYLNKAKALLERAYQFAPSRFELVYELVQTEIFLGNYDKAIALLENSLEKYPELGNLHWYLGTVYGLSDDLEKAKTSYEQAIFLGYKYEKNLTDLYRYGEFAAKSEDYNLVIDVYQKIFELKPDDYNLPAAIAVSFQELGNFEEAKKWAQIALDLNPNQELKRELENFILMLE